LTTVPAAQGDRINRYIRDLDSPEFEVRERASKELENQRTDAEAALRRFLAGNPPVEMRKRIEALLDLPQRTESTQALRLLRAIQVLEHMATPGARTVLQRLAGGWSEAMITREAQAALNRMEKR
jgi:hypothetical protein